MKLEDAEKVRAAAETMVEEPLFLIKHILLKHETAVIEVMRELDVENAKLRGHLAILRDSAKDVIAWCDQHPPAGDALYCITRLRNAIETTETPKAKLGRPVERSESPGATS